MCSQACGRSLNPVKACVCNGNCNMLTSVAIHTGSIFGGKYVSLEPGAEDKYMESGDVFEVTQGSVDVQNLLDLIIGQAKSNQAEVKKQLEELKKLRAGLKG